MPDFMIATFGHHLIPLLSLPGTAGVLGGKAHFAAVKEVCKAVERIHGALMMAGRFEVAVVPAAPDFFDPAPGMAKVRNLAWEMFRNTPRLLWVIFIQHPEFIAESLPPTWIGKGFQNVCLGLVDDGAGGFPEKLQALRKAPVHRRMLFLSPSSPHLDLTGGLHGIDWVVFSGNPGDRSLVARIEAACRKANVAFLFHQPDGDMEFGTTNDFPDDEAPWPVHPFGAKIQLFQPTLPDLKPVVISTPVPFSPPVHVKITPESSPSAKIEITDSLVHSASETSTPTAGVLTEIVKFEVVPPELVTPEADPALLNISDDANEFYRLDHIVRRGLSTFVEVGQALEEIRSRELWRVGGHPSWATYCQEVGGLTKVHANRLIVAAMIANHLKQVKPVGSTLGMAPRSESQVRPLARLDDPEKQLTAWSLAVERANGQPTAQLISTVVAEIMGEYHAVAEPKPNRKQVLADTIRLLRAAVIANSPIDQMEILISNLEKLLKLV